MSNESDWWWCRQPINMRCCLLLMILLMHGGWRRVKLLGQPIFTLPRFLKGKWSIHILTSQEVGPRVERLKYIPTPFKPSLWRNHAFDIAAFSDHLFSFSRNFPSDFQRLSAPFPSHLSTLLEAQLVRFLLVKKVLREKCSNSLWRT